MSREAIISEISKKIQDYRHGEWAGPSPAHINQWIGQFNASVQESLLVELNHILSRTYVSRDNATRFLVDLAKNPELTGSDPKAFWRTVGILDIQLGGSSQREMRAEFDRVLHASFGYGVVQCEPTSGQFVYLDDAIFSGMRLRADIEEWLPSAPTTTQVHVVTMGLHRSGEWYAKSRIEHFAKNAGKKVNLRFWRCLGMEDRRKYTDSADVLRPSMIPQDPAVGAYVQGMIARDAKYAPMLRQGSSLGEQRLFSSADSRNMFEQEMLKTGAHIRVRCRNLPEAMRPLGFTRLNTLGFGATLVTYRNCPNNCPLAFWVNEPWYPLFPRRTNAQVAAR